MCGMPDNAEAILDNQPDDLPSVDTRRIDHPPDGFDAGDTEITLVGLGSGGASLLQARHDRLLTCGGERA